jgi:putative ABC transport system ATP-binding protein
MFGVLRGAHERRRRAEGLVERVGLGHRISHKPGELSGGEKQRLAIARSLANSPEIIFADEPTGNLDSKTSDDILDLLELVRREEGTALVIVTHDRFIAERAERIVALKDGCLVNRGVD